MTSGSARRTTSCATRAGCAGSRTGFSTPDAMAAPSSPPLSVIITSHDYERYLGDAIASALDQRGAAAEVIVVDDGSTDGSREVIESFGDRVTAIFQANAGQAVAQNRGYRASSGGAAVFLPAARLLDPDAASHVLAPPRGPPPAEGPRSV